MIFQFIITFILVFISLNPMQTASASALALPSDFFFVSANNKNKNTKPGEEDIHVWLIPGRPVFDNQGRLIPPVEPVSVTAGSRFSLTVVITDSELNVLDEKGQFRFTWSADNFINPSAPPVQPEPFNTNRVYPVKDGTAEIKRIDYDECGAIKLTGSFRQQSQGPDKPLYYGESVPIIVAPYRFLLFVDTDAPSPHPSNKNKHKHQGQRDEDDDEEDSDQEEEGKGKSQGKGKGRGKGKGGDENEDDDEEDEDEDDQDDDNGDGDNGDDESSGGKLIAGDPFKLVIMAVNENGQITQNYPYHNNQETNRVFQLIPEVLEPEDAFQGELRINETEATVALPVSLFEYGICAISNLSYSDIGTIRIRASDWGYFGTSIQGLSAPIGEFHPHHFRMEIEQPPAIQGYEAAYTYAGQPFSATVTISAMNGYQVPGITKNYHGSYPSPNSGPVVVDIKGDPPGSISLQTPNPVPQFTRGEAIVILDPMILDTKQIGNPRNFTFSYRYEDGGGTVGEGESESVEFRCGRLRIQNGAGFAGDHMRLFFDILHYQDDRWQLNMDEEVLSMAPGDLNLRIMGQGQGLAIAGSRQAFFGGRIRGGEDPIRIESPQLGQSVKLIVNLDPDSILSFLDTIPGYWSIHPRQSQVWSTVLRKNTGFLYEIEP